MKFAESIVLMWLWAVVPICILSAFFLRHRTRKMHLFIDARLCDDVAASFSIKRYKIKQILLVLVLMLSVVALARPQWGFEWQQVTREGLDIFIAIDTSKSMLTQDVKPNRLERTKLAVRDLIKRLNGDRIGLIAFAGESFVMCPLTVDYGGFLLSLDSLAVDTIPRGGTAIAKAIQEGITGYKDIPSKYKALVLITDGENLEGDPLKLAQEAQRKGVKIYTIGIGTQQGELIQVTDGRGEKVFLKDGQGNFVKSRLNEKLLQQIALSTGGAYVRASGAQFGLDVIYDTELAKQERREIESKMEKRYYERFQIPLGIAVLLLILETLIITREKDEK